MSQKRHAVASGPSSMLQLDHGFQFGCGGDQETTPGLDCILMESRSSESSGFEYGIKRDTGSSFDASCIIKKLKRFN
jgi:hypothetical protein